MTSALSSLIASFAGRRALVIGEAMLDVYLEGSSSRLCQEAPVPVVAVRTRNESPGGAANTALNVAALGGRAALVSAVGDDAPGDALRRGLSEAGVDHDGVVAVPGRRTLAKQRVVADSQVLVRFDEGDTEPLGEAYEDRLIEDIAARWADCDVVLVSDYGYGALTPRVIGWIGRLQRRSRRVVVADSKDLGAYRQAGVTVIKPNHRQAAQLIEAQRPGGDRVEAVAQRADALLHQTGARLAAITFDADGALFVGSDGLTYRTYGRPVPPSQTSGAGDTLAAALGLALCAGADVPTAAELSSAAASVAVGKSGTSSCSASELRERPGVGDKYVADATSLAERVAFYKGQGRRVVFTNGCFDLLHCGHITYLNRAKALGDVLVVAVNSDEGVARLKGPGRPIQLLEDRVQILAALSSVDHIVAFSEDTPVHLIRALRPDVFVKGGDYTPEILPEAPVVEELGGVVHILPYVNDRSTTGIVERIRGSSEGASA